MNSSDKAGMHDRGVLQVFDQGAQRATGQTVLLTFIDSSGAAGRHELAVSVAEDVEKKRLAMVRISERPFVSDANGPHFSSAQRWIVDCGRQVGLPLNFCGGLLIVRLWRLIASPSEQTPNFVAAVQEAAAAYDFAFLALGHADDEADVTLVRDGRPTRFVTHPDTRAVDGINLLLSGVAAMQEILNAWPRAAANAETPSTWRHPLAVQITEELIRALKEASFPILLDRSGAGHQISLEIETLGLAPIQIDGESLNRVDAFTRHRAHTYFMRATILAALLAGYTDIEPDLLAVLDEFFRHGGYLGAATDDLQDVFVDFATGIHSVCTVMAHLCVSEDATLRPSFRKNLSPHLLREQQDRLASILGVPESESDRAALVTLLNEIGLRRALAEQLEAHGTLIAGTIHRAVINFGFSTELLGEMVAIVCRDPKFSLPEAYLSAIRTIEDESVLQFMNLEIGKFIADYILDRFWPKV